MVLVEQVLRLKVRRGGATSLAAELGISRLLTEQGVFLHFPRLIGALELVDGDHRSPLLVAEQLSAHQGDAWRYVTHYLQRFLEDAQLRPLEETQQMLEQLHGANEAWVHTLGRRTGELHLALAAAAPWGVRPVDAADLRRWSAATRGHAAAALAQLRAAGPAEQLDGLERRLLQRIDAAGNGRFEGLIAPCHGGYHLGRVLVAQNDVIITDFQQHPAALQPGAGDTPLRDVAGMLCSLERAAQRSLQAALELGLGQPPTARLLALEWLHRSRGALLRGYVEVTADHGLYGPTLQQALPVAELFVLETMLRELRDELAADVGQHPGRVEQRIARLRQQLESGVQP